MSDLNVAMFIGRVGKDPEIKYTQDGTAVANFSIACGESWKDKAGNKKEKTEWIRCVAWRKLAEIISQYVHKGQQIFVSGKFTTREWEKEGVKQYTTEIVVNVMQMLGGKSDSQDKPKPEARSTQGSDDPFGDEEQVPVGAYRDGIPF